MATTTLYKFQLLLRGRSDGHDAAFRERVFNDIVPATLRLQPDGFKVGMVTADTPRLTVLPLRRADLALQSIWSTDAKWVERWRQAVATAGLTVHGYRVAESVPVACTRDWADGETSPGVVLLTLLRQNSKLSYAAFMHEWHGRHTPKALRIHPFWNYIRNVIEAPVVPDSPPFQGIVEEHFRTRATCLNPVRMFGGPLKFIPHMIEVGLHAKHFLDLKQTENYLLTDTWIRTPPAPSA